MTLRSDWLPTLAAFESAARHQNFAHAAHELNLTASAVSHHVRKLEARLGIALFHRHARGVLLTPSGLLLADATSSTLADLDDVIGRLRRSPADNELVRIVTLHSWSCGWLLPRLPSFAALHPGIRLSIETGAALSQFEEGGPDLGIRLGGGHWPGLAAHLLMPEHLFPVASPAMVRMCPIESVAAVARMPLIGDAGRQGWHDWFRAAKVRGVTPDERFHFSDSNAALNAAALGLGIALARDRTAEPFIQSGRLVQLPVPVLRGRWSYYIVYPAHRRLRGPAQRFVEWLQGEAARAMP
ncbi:LysR family transcriptional regulator [Luteibacter jiangsuensis]|uniref:LysR family transcriptional regulator n=1 Tax=Luteibacter jiangsuensis TaxID=637577 RepID=A0ABX0Q3G3_9GAMM|nr:LysR substrate-binding domain-containing protein [Luteibacter jiangsuensis]NID04505.1 LysR family transcriptional regulator [Luteibacter jiangsuensis]